MLVRRKILLAFLIFYPFIVFSLDTAVLVAPQTQPFATASLQEVEDALRTAKIVKSKDLGTGVTRPLKFTLDNGQFEFHACFKSVDERRSGVTRLETGLEVDFKDSWKYEVAAYELDKLLGLGMVPVTVERYFDGKEGSVQLWVENAMTEKERKAKQMEPPDPADWNRQIAKVRVFDNLIYNIDRNLGNVMITSDWKIYMIDHSRSFKNLDELKSPKDLKLFSLSLIDALGKLDEPNLTAHCGQYLSSTEIKTLIKRRDLILQYYTQQKATLGTSIEYP